MTRGKGWHLRYMCVGVAQHVGTCLPRPESASSRFIQTLGILPPPRWKKLIIPERVEGAANQGSSSSFPSRDGFLTQLRAHTLCTPWPVRWANAGILVLEVSDSSKNLCERVPRSVVPLTSALTHISPWSLRGRACSQSTVYIWYQCQSG